jgi:hypothetical protein
VKNEYFDIERAVESRFEMEEELQNYDDREEDEGAIFKSHTGGTSDRFS